MKADLTVVPGSIDLSAIRAWIGERTTLVFGSLHPPEFRLLQSVIRAQAKRGHAIILAPRNPKFAEEWQRALTSAGITCCRRSVGLVAQTSVMLLDSMGELASLYELADSAFVGGSLVGDVGGHNPLEVIQQSVPLLMGPECRNFADLVDELKKSEAMQSCIDADAVALAIDRLLSDRAFARSMVERATRVLEANRGALANTLMMIKDCLSARQ
jgi:3-deoxy-D-manno-octulosonic-acid transferase